MLSRQIALALLASLSLTGCGSSISKGCSSASDVNPAGAALTDDIQKAEASGKLDRGKAAEAMARVMNAAQTYEQSHDVGAFCTEIAKIRKDSGV
ncbi:MAG: hypothetical protein GC190_04700 [Alphaproteobacteria bacterium]|nr:hypothetical protein [Alphaproteobacteria bacterium]